MLGWCKWLIRRWVRFRRLPVRARHYLIEAVFYLLAARLALRVIPFRWLIWFFERPPKQPQVTDAERERMRKGVRWLMDEAAWFLPGETTCFPRAIVVQAMLRRHGVCTTLYYGAARSPDGELKTHVWVKDGTEGVVGHLIAGQYHILARYPD
jgi:hypothetical protein